MTPPLSNKTHIGILDAGGEKVVRVEELRDSFNVDGLIRLHAEDFALLVTISQLFVHFNLEITLNEVGRRYAILPIVKPGQSLSDGQEVLPIVDPGRFRLGTCIEVLQRVPLDQVTAEQFAHSLPTIRTPEQLRSTLVKRYAKIFPRLTNAEIITRGCTVTRFVLDQQ